MINLKISQSLINELIKHNPHDKIKATNFKGLQIHKKKIKTIFFYSRKINNVTFKKSIGDIKVINLSSLDKIIDNIINPHKNNTQKRTFSSICNHFIENVTPLYSKRYQNTCIKFINKNIRIYFHDFDINDITKNDVKTWLREFHSPSTSNNNLIMLSLIIKHAQKMGFHNKVNPCKGLSKRSNRVVRYMTKKEFKRLSKAFKSVHHEVDLLCLDVIKLLIFTGARRNEITLLKWEDIRDNKIFLKQSKTGEKVIYLSKQALSIINKYKDNNSPYVFVYKNKNLKQYKITAVFKELKQIAKIDNLRMHDLRHTFASIGIQAQVKLTTLGKILGHKDLESTLIYAHLDNKTVDKATEKVSEKIFTSLIKSKDRR